MSARSLDVEVRAGRVRPRYLGARDRSWVRAVLAAIDRQEGRRATRAHRAIRGAAGGIGRHYEVAPQAISLLLAIERERWSSRVAAEIPPERAREVVFELAAQLPREEALQKAAEALGIAEPELVEEALFADHPTRRLFVAPWSEPSVDAAIERYNRALVLSLLARSSVITAPAPDPMRLSSAAKQAGLLCAFTTEPRIQLAGPLALESDRARYAKSLVRFLPRLASLSARVHLDDVVAELDLASPVIGTPSGGSWEILGELLRAFAGSPYRVEPARETIAVGTHLIVPDVKLVSLFGVVHADLRPRHTKDGLPRARAIARAAPVPTIVEPWRSSLSDAKQLCRAADAALTAFHGAALRPRPPS